MESSTESESKVLTEPVYPTIKESWAFLGWFLLIIIAVIVPYIILFKGTLNSRSPYGILFTVLINILLLAFLRWKAGYRWHRLNIIGQEKTGLYIMLPLIVLGEVMALSVIQLLHLPNWSNATFQNLAHHPLIAFGVGGVLAPISEELLFRGVLLQGLLRNYRPWVAIGQTALLFGIVHFNPAQSLNAFFIGLLLGWLYYRTRSLLVCIAVHVLHNSLSFGMMIMYPEAGGIEDTIQFYGSVWMYLGVVLISALILLALLWRVKKVTSLSQEKLLLF
jgi:membrane protease YdiL (CAAX protease family)